MRSRWLAVLVLVLVGCDRKTVGSGNGQVASTQQRAVNSEAKDTTNAGQEVTARTTQVEREPEVNARVEGEQAALQVNSMLVAASRQDLDVYLRRFRSDFPWTYSERKQGELSGRWFPKNGDDDYVEFETGGKKGAFATLFAGQTAIGCYAISPQGKVVAYAKALVDGEVAGIGVHFELENGRLIGPKGPNPQAVWIRQAKHQSPK
ncbi:MAG: hypothetical protein AAGG44_01915 [Planctomycetota bacterium]